MKVIFVYFDFMLGAGGKYYEGIASISAVLKAHGHSTRLFHITSLIDRHQFIRTFESNYSDADIVAFSATSNVFSYVSEYSQTIKERFGNILIICGGAHATLCPEDSIQQDGLDIICIGEGEYPMLDLCTTLETGGDITGIQNLWVKKDGRIFRNPLRSLIEDLDSLPMPDRELFDFEHSIDKKMKRLPFMCSRGCPFNCTHCCNHAFKKVCGDSKAYVRFKSTDRILMEIKSCIGKYQNVESNHFLDDILTLKTNWFKNFAQQYQQQINYPYVCNSRFDLLNAEQIELLKQSGCICLQLGLESGDSYIRNSVLKRNQTTEQILNVSNLVHQSGMKISVYTMIGIPFETPRRFLNTIKMTAAINPSNFQISIYYPYVRTALYEICRENGFLTGKRLDSYFEAETTLNLPDFSRKEILFGYDNFGIFVSYYIAAEKLLPVLKYVVRKTVDFMWLHPKVYHFTEPKYQAVKKLYKSLRATRQ